MTHVSKASATKKARDEMEKLLTSLMENAGARTRSKVLTELLTSTERVMLIKRLLLISLLKRGVSTHQAAHYLKMSPSTVARFQEKVRRGHYRHTSQWLRQTVVHNHVLHTLEQLAAIPFDVLSKNRGRVQKD